MVQRLTVQMCRAATVQEFLERFEIGKILGVGGAPPLPSTTSCRQAQGAHSPPTYLPSQGSRWSSAARTSKLARKSPSRCSACMPAWVACRRQRWSATIAEHTNLLQVVEKARYEQGDNSLLREIEILCKVGWTATTRHARDCQHSSSVPHAATRCRSTTRTASGCMPST